MLFSNFIGFLAGSFLLTTVVVGLTYLARITRAFELLAGPD